MTMLPPLPAPFADCPDLLDRDRHAAEALPLTTALSTSNLAAGIDALLQKWGPGDRRAAASLWSQGYFLRLLRPFLAYGTFEGIWFSLQADRVFVAFSEMSTASGFFLPQMAETADEALQLAFEHIGMSVTIISRATNTAERLHRSNAEYAISKALVQMRVIGLSQVDESGRLQDLHARIATIRPELGRRIGARDDVPQRRICCLRYRLERLSKCVHACPVRQRPSERPGPA